MMKQQRTISIYQKLLLLFFLVLLPFFVLSLAANHVAEKRLLQQGEARIEAQLAQKVESYEALHWRTYSWMKVNLMDGYKVMLANNMPISSYQLGQQVAELFKDLQKLAMMSDEISDICVYMPRTNRTVSLRGYYDRDVPADAKMRIRQYSQAYNTFVRLDEGFRIHTILASGSNPEPLYVVEITLDDATLLKNLNSAGEEKYAILTQRDVELCDPADKPLLVSLRDSVTADPADAGQIIHQGHLISYKRFQTEYYLVSYIPMEVLLEPVQSFNLFSVIVLTMAILCSLLVTVLLGRTIQRPFSQLLTLFRRVEAGDMEAALDARQVGRNEFSVIFERFNHMLAQIRALISKSVEQEKALQLAEYRNLQAHIAPHFLYNSFNVLRHSIRMGDQETSEKMAGYLGSYFRYLTYMDARADVTLQEEYRHVTDYLAIQKLRFQDGVTFSIDTLPEKYSHLRIPPFTLQPLVENIFKHGINDIARAAAISLRVAEEADRLVMIVRDNGVGMEQQKLEQLRHAMAAGETPQEHTGIIHIYRRLRYYFGDDCDMQVSSKPDEYFEVRIALPVREEL